MTFQVVSVITNCRRRETVDPWVLSHCMPFQVPISCAIMRFGRWPGLFDSARAAGTASAMAHVTKRIAELLRTNRLSVMLQREDLLAAPTPGPIARSHDPK